MPKRVLRREVNVTEDEADSVLASLKSFQINKMTPIYCDDEPHKIRYILLKYISELLSTEASSLCPWCGKLLVCLSTGRSSLPPSISERYNSFILSSWKGSRGGTREHAPSLVSKPGSMPCTRWWHDRARDDMASESSQPTADWMVQTLWCPCKFCFDFGTCVHTIHALRVTSRVDSEGKVLVRRKKKRSGNVAPETLNCRSRNGGPCRAYRNRG
ncbi:hypothetical protein GQ600_16362 [Phytophthora cactorum]|nr:hypothetical protein GQ600_16362 [Phytophthora cactorum]